MQDAVKAYHDERQKQSLEGIGLAKSRGLLRTDLQSIYQSAYQGLGERLYVRIGYIQPALVDESTQSLTVADDPAGDGVTDDVVSDIIELVVSHGGDVVFLPQELAQDDIALVTRY